MAHNYIAHNPIIAEAYIILFKLIPIFMHTFLFFFAVKILKKYEINL